MADRPAIQVRTYDQGSQAATGAAFQADAAEALRNGYAITSQVWAGSALTVTYQLTGAKPARKRQSPGHQALGCAVLLLVSIGIIGFLGQRRDQPTAGAGGTPAPTVPAGDLSLSDVTVTSRVVVGDTVEVGLTATNDGAGPAPFTLRVGGASGKAEFRSCTPSCADQDEILGTRYLAFPDLPAGRSRTYTLVWRTLEVGHIDWTVSPKANPDDLWGATPVFAP